MKATTMSDRFSTCLALTLEWEGGFADDPRDPGGATCCGITLSTYQHWAENPALGVDDIRNITKETVAAIYSTNYWNAMRCDAMAPGVDLMLFDEGVNAGCGRSVRLLQTALQFPPALVDGCVGPNTIAQATRADPTTLIRALGGLQLSFYRSLPTFATFGTGWTRRLQNRQAAALSGC